MAFQMRCPKCGLCPVTITRERNSFAPTGGEPVLQCSCGKRLYGEKAINAEYDRQKAAWKEPSPKPKPTKKVTKPVSDQAAAREFIDSVHNEVVTAHQEASRFIPEADAIRDGVQTVRAELGLTMQDCEATRRMNLLEIETAKVRRLVNELGNMVKRTGEVWSVRGAQAVFKNVQSHYAEIGKTIERLPALAARAEDTARLEASSVEAPIEVETAVCAFIGCENPPAPKRKYCGDDCRKRQARHNYEMRNAEKRGRLRQ